MGTGKEESEWWKWWGWGSSGKRSMEGGGRCKKIDGEGHCKGEGKGGSHYKGRREKRVLKKLKNGSLRERKRKGGVRGK